MFGLFHIQTKEEKQNLKQFNEAIRNIKILIASGKWNDAKIKINESLDFQKKYFLNKIKNFLEKKEKNLGKKIINYKKELEKRIKILKKLDEKRKKEEKKYLEKIENEKLRLRLKFLKKEIEKLISTDKFEEAKFLIKKVIQEYPKNKKVINFYNKQKNILQKKLIEQKRKEEEQLKQNAKIEALKLIGGTVKIKEKEINKNNKKNFLDKIIDSFNFYKKLNEIRKNKEIIDEIKILLKEEKKIKDDLISKKLENIHKGLVKEIFKSNMIGYDFYGKILGAEKISGDIIGIQETKEKYDFYIGDATGKGIKAGLLISLLSKTFNQFSNEKNFKKMVFNINNELKQKFESKNFVTAIFFNIKKENYKEVNFIGMGHEPILYYNRKEDKIKKIYAGGLAAGVLKYKKLEQLKENKLIPNNGDIILTYSDGIIELKNKKQERFGIENLIQSFHKISKYEKNPKKIYDFILKELKNFNGGSNFPDDITMIILSRNFDKDIINNEEKKEEIIKELNLDWAPPKRVLKELKGKTKDEIYEELKEIERKRKIENIVKNLKNLYYTGEILKLKQEAIRYIKDGFIDKRINYYLKKAIEQEQTYKIKLKEEKVRNKYLVLNELLKQGDYNTVIKEVEDIIAKDGNI